MFILRSSKTHNKSSFPQTVKISQKQDNLKDKKIRTYCPYRRYLNNRGAFNDYEENFFVFKGGSPVEITQFHNTLKLMIKIAGFDYSMHSLRGGHSLDLMSSGLSVETIKKLGRWKSNAVYNYLKL